MTWHLYVCAGLATRRSNQFAFDPITSAMVALKDSTKSLKETLVQVFQTVSRSGSLTIETLHKLQYLLKTGGPNWFTSCLIEELLSVVYQVTRWPVA